jgi:predicted peroxiredoxin
MDKLLLIVTHGTDDSERATIPFVIGLTATISEVQPTIILQMEGAWIAKKGYAKLIKDPAFPPLEDLLKDYLSGGGRLMICGPCARKRDIKSDDLIEGVTVVNAPAIVKEIADTSKVLVY